MTERTGRRLRFFIAAIIVVLLLPLIFIWGFWGATPFCPWSHQLSLTWSCRIVDIKKGVLLIEHFDASMDSRVDLQLSMHQLGKVTWIEHPYGKAQNLAPRVTDNTIKFDRSDSKYLLVNGERFQIHARTDPNLEGVPSQQGEVWVMRLRSPLFDTG
jgi:hypothetical protein